MPSGLDSQVQMGGGGVERHRSVSSLKLFLIFNDPETLSPSSGACNRISFVFCSQNITTLTPIVLQMQKKRAHCPTVVDSILSVKGLFCMISIWTDHSPPSTSTNKKEKDTLKIVRPQTNYFTFKKFTFSMFHRLLDIIKLREKK